LHFNGLMCGLLHLEETVKCFEYVVIGMNQ